MYTKELVLALFLNQVSASTTADETFASDLAGCQSFAGKFANTCGSTSAQVAFSAIPTATQTCTGDFGNCPDNGTVSGDTCSFSRKLCVTCFDSSGTVKIHVQSNGLPDHCMYIPRGQPAATEVDFTVNWMSAATQLQTKTEQGALNELVCDFSVSKDVPAAASYVNNAPSEKLSSGWGIAVTGVMIFNGIAGTGVDAFYPAVYAGSGGLVTDASSAQETADYCLAHPSPNGDYHYHSASPCAIGKEVSYASTPFQYGAEYGGDIRAWMEQEWLAVPYQSAFGISKDGRPIYSPYNNNGQMRQNCDVDICNGFTDANGNYAYQTTFHHPYVMGCFGKGNSPEIYQQCTTQPRLCNVLYFDNAVTLRALTWTFLASTALLFTLF